MRKPSTPEAPEYFMKQKFLGLTTKFRPMVRAGFLKRSDRLILDALAEFGTPRSYRIKTTAKMIAEYEGVSESSVRTALSRLITAGIVARCKDPTGGLYYVIDPDIVEFSNDPSQRAAAYAELARSTLERRQTVFKPVVLRGPSKNTDGDQVTVA